MFAILTISLRVILISNIKYLIRFFIIVMMLTRPYMKRIFRHNIFFHSYGTSLDSLSRFLVLLRLWITVLMCLSMKLSSKLQKLIFLFSSLNLILIFRFIRKNLINFYIFFELSLIPTLLIILGWGLQPERIRAGRFLIIYTLIGSLPLLGCLLFMEFHCGTLKTFILIGEIFFFNIKDYNIYCILWVSAFLIKLPIYGVHLWLPKAHVEAPVAGSMVLAGLLLKLGAYGLVRSLHFLDIVLCTWSKILFTWSIVTMCIVGFMCFRQCDLKSLVAYSSVAHMTLILASCFRVDIIGIKGIMGILISHGLCSSGLFFGVQCYYETRGTRKIFLNRGMLLLSPIFCMMWFLLCVGKASAPPSLNLFREFFLIRRIIKYGWFFSFIFCGIKIFVRGLFSIYLYIITCHGKWTPKKRFWLPINNHHLLVLFLHIFPLYIIFILKKSIFWFV